VLDPHDDPSSPAAPSAAASTARTPGTRAPDAHLAWRPSWRDRLEGAIGSTPTGRLVAAAAAVVAGLVVVGVVLLRGPAPPPPELALPVAGAQGDPAVTTTTASPTSSTSAPDADVVVHAAGAVARPGVYRLAGGARVSELLDAAGGPAPGADLDRLNLAAPLVDGEQVFVPLPDQDPPLVGPPGGGAPAAPATTPPGLVDLNRATLDELDELPGVGPSTAQAILDERERRGGFTAVDELLDVRGIGDAKLAALRDLVRV
jgi:competence protein ComEA